jgi:hypothetical protein
MKPVAALCTVLILSLFGVACGGDGDGKGFTRADLPGLVLARDKPPPKMQKENGPAGFRFLEQHPDLDSVVKTLRSRGMEANYGSQFSATTRKADLGFVETVAFLFHDKEAAGRGLDYVCETSSRRIKSAANLPALDAGDASCGHKGSSDGYPVAAYGVQVADVVLLATAAPTTKTAERSSIEGARKLAEQLEARTNE